VTRSGILGCRKSAWTPPGQDVYILPASQFHEGLVVKPVWTSSESTQCLVIYFSRDSFPALVRLTMKLRSSRTFGAEDRVQSASVQAEPIILLRRIVDLIVSDQTIIVRHLSEVLRPFPHSTAADTDIDPV
jgi:hypothetical protein